MEKLFFFLLLSTFMMFNIQSCDRTQLLGTGVSEDKHGNLKIDVPLYIVEKNKEKPELKIASSSMNLPVRAVIDNGRSEKNNSIEITGGIVKGRLSIIIKKPQEILLREALREAMYYWHVPKDFFIKGANSLIGELFLSVDDSPINLYPSDNLKFTTKISEEEYLYYIDGDHFSLHCVGIIVKYLIYN